MNGAATLNALPYATAESIKFNNNVAGCSGMRCSRVVEKKEKKRRVKVLPSRDPPYRGE